MLFKKTPIKALFSILHLTHRNCIDTLKLYPLSVFVKPNHICLTKIFPSVDPFFTPSSFSTPIHPKKQLPKLYTVFQY